MTQSAIDIDFAKWKATVAEIFRGTFSGVDGERGTTTNIGNMREPFAVGADLYDSNTNLMSLMNDSATSNQYLSSVLTAENARVGKLDVNARRDIYKLREQSMSVVYSADLCGFLTGLLKVILVTSMLFLAVLSATKERVITPRSGIILGVLVMLVFGGVLLSMCTNAAMRRNNAWGHYYWDAGVAGHTA